jgi:hypothetical protein
MIAVCFELMQLIAQKLMKIKLLKNIGLFIWFPFYLSTPANGTAPDKSGCGTDNPQVAENEMAPHILCSASCKRTTPCSYALKIPTRAAANSHQKQNQGFLACQRHRHPCTTLKASGEVV